MFSFQKFMRTDWVTKTVNIAPGHRILINKFVTKVHKMIKAKNTLSIKRKKLIMFYQNLQRGKKFILVPKQMGQPLP